MKKVVVRFFMVLGLAGLLTVMNGCSKERTRNTLVGTTLGAVTGLGIGAAVGGTDGPLIGALIGGGTGGLIGNAATKDDDASKEK